MDCYPANPEPDCVFNVHWRCNGIDEVTPSTQATVYSIQAITHDPAEPYIPYDELTPDVVIGWVKDALGDEEIAGIQANLDAQILNILTPPVVNPPLPWQANNANIALQPSQNGI